MHYPKKSNTNIHEQNLTPFNLDTKDQTDHNTQSSDEIQIFDNESSDSSEFTKILQKCMIQTIMSHIISPIMNSKK